MNLIPELLRRSLQGQSSNANLMLLIPCFTPGRFLQEELNLKSKFKTKLLYNLEYFSNINVPLCKMGEDLT
jgi:hypothetical protein